jgi:ATP-dependent exoDNAse (exonuclease V) beta subunit
VPAGDGFFATREVRDVRLLLTALTVAHDDLAWAGLLRSPWVGLCDDALLRLHRLGGGAPFVQALGSERPGGDGEALAFARRWIDELRRLRDRVSCAALIERALERSGYGAMLLYQQGGDVALANLRKLVRMADGRPEESVAGFLGWMVERGESSAREGEAALHTQGEDVVTLTTIHGAKGLEWPVVFLCDLDRDMPGGTNAPSLYFDAEDGIGIKLTDGDAPEGEQVCGAYECLHEQARRRDLAEEKRVWYVASTRARDRLVLCAKPPSPVAAEGKKKPTPAHWLLGGLTVDGETFRYGQASAAWKGAVVTTLRDLPTVDAPAPPRYDDLAPQAAESTALVRRIRPVPATMPLVRRSATELMAFAKDPTAHRRSYLLGLRLPTFARAASPDGERADDGAELDARTTGDIVHAVMELDEELVHRDLDAILERELSSRLGADAATRLSPTARERLRRLIERTHSHEAVARLFAGTHVERELPFTWFLGVDGEVSVMHGAMDLVARVDGALEVLDFKTHRLQPGEEVAAAAPYALQRDLYAAVLHETVGTPAAFSLFFPETGGEVRTVLGAGAASDACERVRGVVRAVTQTTLGEAAADERSLARGTPA